MADEKNTKKKNKKRKKRNPIAIAAIISASFFVLFFVCAQIYIINARSVLVTESMLPGSMSETIDAKVFIVRDESFITSSGANIVSAVADGSRVGADTTVAYSFADSNSAGNIIRMAQINEQLEYYASLTNVSSSSASDTTQYDNRIRDDVYAFSKTAESGKYIDLSDSISELTDAVTARQRATGVELDVSSAVSALESEYASLRASTGSYAEITSDTTGYYISGSDGCENALDYSRAGEWTIEEVEAAFALEPVAQTAGTVGRIVHGYYWYLACIVDSSQAQSLNEGDRKTISFLNTATNDVTAQIYSIKTDSARGKSLIVFRCMDMNEELASLRTEDVRITLKTHEGYRVDIRAIRSDSENRLGVYVVVGERMQFKFIKKLYTGEDYCIVTNKSEDGKVMDDYVMIYDEYIVEGTELFSGKLIS